jgi:hypothetical protein
MTQILSRISLTQNFSFDEQIVQDIDTICKARFLGQRPSYKEDHLKENSLQLVERIKLFSPDEIAIKKGNGDENDNDGQAGGQNKDFDDIKNALKEGWNIEEPPMSLIELSENLSKIYGKKYVIGDGRTRWEILREEYNCQKAPFTVYSLTENNEAALKRALAFLTHGKNAENNSSVCSVQTRPSIVLAAAKLIMDDVIELDSKKEKFKDFEEAAYTIESIFGQNRIFRIPKKKEKIQSILDAALPKASELDPSFMKNQVVWNTKKLAAWLSGNTDNDQISVVSSQPVCFIPATYHPSNPNLCISKGVVVRMHDINSKNDFWRSVTQHRRNWTSDASKQTSEMKKVFKNLPGREIKTENPDDYILNIVFYKTSILGSEMEKSNLWKEYSKSFQDFMSFQFDFQKNMIEDSLPNKKNLLNTNVENFSGQNSYRIVGAVPSCTNYQDMTEIVPYNPNPKNGEYFEFDATLLEDAQLPVSPNVVPKRKHYKTSKDFKKNSVINYDLFGN